MDLKPTKRQLEYWAAAVTGGISIMLAICGKWVFADAGGPEENDVWALILAEPSTLGFLRLALLMLGLFVVVSIPALMVAGRWIKGFSTSGLTADDAKDAELALRDLREQYERVRRQRDEILSLVTQISPSTK